MKDKFKKWFGLDEPDQIEAIDINHAAAALMVEVMAADHQWNDVRHHRSKHFLIIN